MAGSLPVLNCSSVHANGSGTRVVSQKIRSFLHMGRDVAEDVDRNPAVLTDPAHLEAESNVARLDDARPPIVANRVVLLDRHRTSLGLHLVERRRETRGSDLPRDVWISGVLEHGGQLRPQLGHRPAERIAGGRGSSMIRTLRFSGS
jgi:hypothetical protein